MKKSDKILLMLTKIPAGKVTTYGELARASRSSPRAVGQVMRHNSQPDKYPCYKVVNSSGTIGGYSGCTEGKNIKRKIALLEKDGITVENGKINLSAFLHKF